MRTIRRIGWVVIFSVSLLRVQGQATNEVELLRGQLREATENFEKIMREQRMVIAALSNRLEAVRQRQAALTNEQQALKEMMAKPMAETAAAPTPVPWSPAQPIPVVRAGNAYMNISFDALLDAGWSTASDVSDRLNLGDHDPLQRGFTLPNAEIALDGAVDPYFKGFANIVLKLDEAAETSIELEEAYLLSTALPANLQVKAGQFLANFGRQNVRHPHQWAFVDQPIILNRAFGPDGLRNPGAQLSWLAPTPFYTEAFLGIMNGQGESSFGFRNRGDEDASGTPRFHGRATFDRGVRGPQDLLVVPRIASSFDLSDEQTLVLGTSAAFGPNDTGPHARTQIYGVDGYWKWKPSTANKGFPFVSWQTEALYERFEAGADPFAPTSLPAETLDDWGFYSQVLWGFKPGWVAALRGEMVTGSESTFDADDPFRGGRTRVSPNLTWYPTEFSKIRLQYNYDHGQWFGDEHSVWLQIEFLLGAHGAHKF